MTLLPRSLFGRLVLVLLCGLTVAQLAGTVLHFDEQVQASYRASGLHAAQRIAAAMDVLDALPAAQRARVAAAFDGPLLRVRLAHATEAPAPGAGSDGPHASMFRRLLQGMLRGDRPLLVSDISGGAVPGAGGPPIRGGLDHRMMMRHHMQAGGPRFRVETRLADGQPVRFEYRPSADPISLPLRLLLVLAVLLISVVVLSLLAVRWITRPLSLLANAAEELGRDIRREPLDEGGPLEVRRAARAFNTMQQRIVRHMEQRTRFLAALSHDLRTPITRLRLRNEFVEPQDLRVKVASDLEEMEGMVMGTLELLRGMDREGPRRPVDLQALLETLQADAGEQGAQVHVAGALDGPVHGDPLALKRCFGNLLNNALRYADAAWIVMQSHPGRVVVVIEDDGPGIPEGERERVFEPFYRIEGSRSRDTGGTGLGLAIVQDVVESMGGRVELGDSAHGGLRVRVELPR